MKKVIKQFRIKVYDDTLCCHYFFKGKQINLDLAVDEYGISNEDDNFVIDDNDKYQKGKMLEKLSLKPDRQFIFCSSRGFKINIFL